MHRLGLVVVFGFALAAEIALVFASPATAAQSSTSERVRADIERFVLERVDSEPSAIEIPELRAFDFDVADGAGDVRTVLSTASPAPLSGRVSVTVALYVGDRLVKRGVVSPYVRIADRVVVAKHPLARGQVVTEADVAIAERDRAASPGDAVREERELVGQRTKRPIAPDQALRVRDFERVPLVERGDRVTLVLEHGPLRVQALGRAQETGGEGDWIRVVNIDSKREVNGRVDGEGRVRVAF